MSAVSGPRFTGAAARLRITGYLRAPSTRSLRAFDVDIFLAQDRVKSLADASKIGLPTDDRIGVVQQASGKWNLSGGTRVELA
jgi:hypothetical protein